MLPRLPLTPTAPSGLLPSHAPLTAWPLAPPCSSHLPPPAGRAVPPHAPSPPTPMLLLPPAWPPPPPCALASLLAPQLLQTALHAASVSPTQLLPTPAAGACQVLSMLGGASCSNSLLHSRLLPCRLPRLALPGASLHSCSSAPAHTPLAAPPQSLSAVAAAMPCRLVGTEAARARVLAAAALGCWGWAGGGALQLPAAAAPAAAAVPVQSGGGMVLRSWALGEGLRSGKFADPTSLALWGGRVGARGVMPARGPMRRQALGMGWGGLCKRIRS